MADQRVTFPSAIALLEPGQSFMVETILIGTHGADLSMGITAQ
jgi:hypothetical protein